LARLVLGKGRISALGHTARESNHRILTDGKGGELHLTDSVEDWLVLGRNPFGLYLYTEDVDASPPNLQTSSSARKGRG
jgi:hypothetical protein